MEQRILARSTTSVVVSAWVMTFTTLAARLLADRPSAVGRGYGRPLAALGRRVTLRQIIDELSAAGKLGAFQTVADTPGLVTAVDAAIAELKRAAIEPDALSAVASDDGPAACLLAVYRRYQQYLQQTGYYDVEGQMWLARDVLAEALAAGQSPATLAKAKAIAVDGFTDFTPTQLEMLRLACEVVERIVITLPIGDDGRDRLWRWTQRTLARIRRLFAGDVDVIAAPPPERKGPAALWDRLFDYDADTIARDEKVQVIAAAGREQEVLAVARRVKRLLAGGVAAGRVAVLVRSAEEYSETIGRVFAACDIPVASQPCPVTEVPVVRFALTAARLSPEFAACEVLSVIGNSYFRPGALGDFDETTVATAQLLISQGGVLSGREAYVQAAERLGRRAACGAAADEDEPDPAEDTSFVPGRVLLNPEAIAKAAEMLARLFDAAEGKLSEVIGALQLRKAACNQSNAGRIARDLRALDALESALSELPEGTSAAYVHEALSAVACPAAGTESLVDALDVLDARALRYDHVFLLGLTEGQFPRRFVDSPLLSEQRRRQWAAEGVELDARDDLTAREMLLFYLAASRADASLTLCMLDSDASGRATAPSAFLTALLAPAGGLDAAISERRPVGELIGRPQEVCSASEALSAAFAGLFTTDYAPAPGAVNWSLANARSAMGLATGGLLAETERWRMGETGRFDGRITDPSLLAALAERHPRQVVFSASRLECFARCPWMYFARYVLGLEEPAAPAGRLEAARRGALCHEALYCLMTGLAEQQGLPVRLWELQEEQLVTALADALVIAARHIEQRWPPVYPVLWQMQLQQLTEHLKRYVLAQRAAGVQVKAESLHFELGFGLTDNPEEFTDPASRCEPATVDCPAAGTIRLRGKIDRVDSVQVDRQSGLMVVDYKTGQLPRRKDIPAGVSVQIPLYAAAAAELLGRPAIGGAYHRVGGEGETLEFAHYKLTGGKVAVNKAYQDETDQAMEQVGRCVKAMAEGRFDLPAEPECPNWCAFGQICRHSRPRGILRTEGGSRS